MLYVRIGAARLLSYDAQAVQYQNQIRGPSDAADDGTYVQVILDTDTLDTETAIYTILTPSDAVDDGTNLQVILIHDTNT